MIVNDSNCAHHFHLQSHSAASILIYNDVDSNSISCFTVSFIYVTSPSQPSCQIADNYTNSALLSSAVDGPYCDTSVPLSY